MTGDSATSDLGERRRRPRCAVLDPLFQQFDLLFGQAIIGRRHIAVSNSYNQFTRFQVAGNDRWDFRITCLERRCPRVQLQATFVLFSVTTKTILAQDWQDLAVEVFGLARVGAR